MKTDKLLHEPITRSIIGAFYEVYSSLGFGFLERVYVKALELELRDAGHEVAREVCVPVFYKSWEIAVQRIDMIVDNKIVIETKASYELQAGAQRQVLNYLRATNLEVGLLLHFGPEAKFYRSISTVKRSAESARSVKSAIPLRLRSRPEVVDLEHPEASPDETTAENN